MVSPSPISMVPVDDAGTLAAVIPLHSGALDGKAVEWSVRDEQGDKLLAVSASTGAVTVSGNAVITSVNVPRIVAFSETFDVESFTDGGAAVGTVAMVTTIPVGAIVLAAKVVVAAGFAGDTSAVLTIGDGTDVDRYNTSTVNVFATAANGIESGVPSGNRLHTSVATVTLTVTTAADFTAAVTNGSGNLTVTILYLATV